MKSVGNKQLAIGNLKRTVFLFVFICQLATANWQLAFAQQPSPPLIKKSDKVEIISGKKFWIHPVEKGQTLYSIAKAYGSTVDILLSNNPDAIDGLKAGDQLKIPYLSPIPSPTGEGSKGVRSDTSQRAAPDTNLRKAINVLNTAEKKDPSERLVRADTAGFSEGIQPIGDIHIALFLPLSLKNMDVINTQKIIKEEEKFPEEILLALEFYEGMKMAFDSLRKQGFGGYLHVFDAGVDSAGIVRLLKKSELKEMDLIIALLYGKRLQPLLKFAKENKINMVCPALTANNALLGNTRLCKIIPSQSTQAEFLARYVCEKYAGKNIILFNSALAKDKPAQNTFRKTANALLSAAKADSIREVTFSTLGNFLSPTLPNIVVVPSASESFAAEALGKLFLRQQQKKDSIIVFGLSNMMDMQGLDFAQLAALHAHFAAYNFVNYHAPETKKFILNYREEYKTEPSRNVFLGFDTGIFFIRGLMQQGNALFKNLSQFSQKGIQSEFNFYQPEPASGYENRGVGIMRLENFSFTRVR